ncbi:MAG: MBL fold metallo-hydrolase [Burkholderiaceae bacterium]|nr:MBL fold metallo-hydrolase [Burkholderiaceae bacterium]
MNPLPASLRFIQRDWLSSNQIVGIEGDEATVVDSGYAKHAQQTVALVKQVLDADRARLVRIVNTHLHSDHCGGNRALVDAFGCTITIPHASADEVAAWDESSLSFAATGQHCPRFVHDATLRPGDTLRLGGLDWDVHAAPGHDPKSVIFHSEREGLLISADALWENGFGIVFPEIEGESGFAEQQAVLELIARLRVQRVLPGHGRMFGDIDAALARAHAKLDAMRSDPARHARHALKVLVKFLLLDVERIEERALHERAQDAVVMRHAAAQIGLDYAQALKWAADSLVEQGLLRRDGSELVDV